MNNLPIAAIDIGGTIEDSWKDKLIWFKTRGYNIGECQKGRREVINLVGGDESLYEQMVREVYNDENILRRELIPGCIDSLKILKTHFRIAILSSRDEQKRNITMEWMKNKEILHLVDETIFVGEKGDKFEWCVNAKVSILIDDDIRHLEPIGIDIPITGIHFCPCKQQGPKTKTNIITATSWQQITELIQNGCFAVTPNFNTGI